MTHLVAALPPHQQPQPAVEFKFRLIVTQAQARYLMEVTSLSGGRRVCRLQELRDEAGPSCHLQLHDNRPGGKSAFLSSLQCSGNALKSGMLQARNERLWSEMGAKKPCG